MMPKLEPIHPGEILLHDFMEPYGLSGLKLAKRVGVPANRITDIVRGRRNITGDTALRLAKLFNTSPELWMNLQSRYDLQMAEYAAIEEIQPLQPLTA